MTSDLRTASEAAFGDAWEQYDSAIERLDAGDIRDACGKAWTLRGRQPRAAALAHGEDPPTTNHISSWIRRMGRQKPGLSLCPHCLRNGHGIYINRPATMDT